MEKVYNSISHREKYFAVMFIVSLLLCILLLSPIIVHAEEEQSTSEVETTETLESVSDGDAVVVDENGEDATAESGVVVEIDLSVLESEVAEIGENTLLLSDSVIAISDTVERLEVVLLVLAVLVAGFLIYAFVHWSLSKKGVL